MEASSRPRVAGSMRGLPGLTRRHHSGSAGTWLLDPYNIIISDFIPDEGIDNGGAGNFTAVADTAQLSTASLIAALNAGNQVVVQTGVPGGGGTEAGDIYLSSANIITQPTVAGGSLTLIADRDIDLFQTLIQGNTFALPVTLKAGRAGAGGTISMNFSSILSNGGDIDLGGYSTFATGPGCVAHFHRRGHRICGQADRHQHRTKSGLWQSEHRRRYWKHQHSGRQPAVCERAGPGRVLGWHDFRKEHRDLRHGRDPL